MGYEIDGNDRFIQVGIMTETQTSEREERVWTRQEIVLTPLPFDAEFVPATLLTEALEAMEAPTDALSWNPTAYIEKNRSTAYRIRAKLSDTKEAGDE